MLSIIFNSLSPPLLPCEGCPVRCDREKTAGTGSCSTWSESRDKSQQPDEKSTWFEVKIVCAGEKMGFGIRPGASDFSIVNNLRILFMQLHRGRATLERLIVVLTLSS